MRDWFRGKRGGLAAFLLIAALVAGGLGWATAAALRLEQEQLDQRGLAEQEGRVRLALWRLDSLVSPHLSREDNRPFNHYSAVYVPPMAFKSGIQECWAAGTVMEPSPLLNDELPDWMSLHFQADAAAGWGSPQVLSAALGGRLQTQATACGVTWPNITPARKDTLAHLKKALPPPELLAVVRERATRVRLRATTVLMVHSPSEPAQQVADQQVNPAPNAAYPYQSQPASQMTANEYMARSANRDKLFTQKNPQRFQKDVAINNSVGNGWNWLKDNNNDRVQGVEVFVTLSPMIPLWLPGAAPDRLVFVRLVHIEDPGQTENHELCQGILLDVAKLQAQLTAEVADLFPSARLLPMREGEPPHPERTMAALPFQLDLGEPAPLGVSAGWTPLRVGMLFAWVAAGVALLAVALGGWSLIDLSERRIRFVSAVTHELRTPLTTLRLYLDMLLDGLVPEEAQREEYLRTLHGEADRLNRLVGNVLDFSRLERQRPQLNLSHVCLDDLFGRLQTVWQARARAADKELVFENPLPAGTAAWTDGALLEQVLGNLIDNACKYSAGAEDRRVWIRVRCAHGRWVFEVEDRGPGIPAPERRMIFRAFRRGRSADVTAGGVGLGLALARRWTYLLGGRLHLVDHTDGPGACFRVTLHCQRGPAAPFGAST
jgi:signal transduction histidine kinase